MARRLVAVEVPTADVTSLDDDVLWCRTERHQWAWQRDQIAAEEENPQAFDRTLVCRTCGAEKVKTISTRSFTVTRSRIRYPVGYLIKGSGRIDASQVYRTQFERRHIRITKAKR
jgi:hypothetical protein